MCTLVTFFFVAKSLYFYTIKWLKRPNLLDRGYGAQIKGGGVTDAQNTLIGLFGARKRNFQVSTYLS